MTRVRLVDLDLGLDMQSSQLLLFNTRQNEDIDDWCSRAE